ncbi:hypothetical protein AK812_SmicGene32601 [Symbiodinium microadriaticum]|uniref:Uncharacterized protein n=1 Tax=Symbiodinium microadriaticum TaxID=2951 RepID=A0A1Q9CTP7_SYMMI|nr:hypothetical protein AK812_SmicGene32601 [Symbiodinium microadriaticum]
MAGARALGAKILQSRQRLRWNGPNKEVRKEGKQKRGPGMVVSKLQQYVEVQRRAYDRLQLLAAEEGPLKERLRQIHAADAGSASQKDLIQHLGCKELVHQSQDEVRRRVVEQFGPLRLEAEGELYNRQLAVAHAKNLGFDFGLSAQDSEMSMMDVACLQLEASEPQEVPRSSSQTVVTLANGAVSDFTTFDLSEGYRLWGDELQRFYTSAVQVAVAMPATVPAGTAQAPMVATPGTVTPGVPRQGFH